MCGICGIVSTDGSPIDQARLRAMADALAHRGPDGEGFFVWPESPHRGGVSVGLGNRRLAVIDPAGGRQPVANEDGSVTVVYNGEIYNYRDLRARLVAQGHRFRTQSDTEVIVHQYEQESWRCVDHFRGMFAFALWDATNRLLLLARDRIGIKPLYYTVQGQELIFASELWSLLRGLGRLPALDPLALAQLFTLQYVPGPQTIFSQIFKLPPATVAIWQDGTLKIVPYWSDRSWEERADGLQAAGKPMSEAALVRGLRARLDDAVQSHLVSDVPIGAFLSGGLDSSLIVHGMQTALGRPVHTFAVGFEGQPAGEGELKHARLVAEAIGTAHQELVMTEAQFADSLPRVIEAMDEPVLDPALVPTYLVSQLARRDVTVVLTGEGGDELFGGYQRYRLQRWAPWVQAVPTWLRPLLLGRVRSLRVRQALEACWASSPAEGHLGWSGSAPLSLLRTLCEDPAHFDQARAQLIDRFEQLSPTAASRNGDSRVATMLARDLRSWLPDDLLVKVDRMSMAVSLEARVPYLDHPLVEWAAALPPSWKVRGGVGKYLLKRVARGRLPASIISRAKQGFAPPLARWLRGPLGTVMTDQLAAASMHDLGFWNRQTVDRWIGAHRRGEDDYSLPLWGLWSFALWYDQAKQMSRTLAADPQKLLS